ncbi:lysophospholipase [Hyalangium sp.]|uniref:alpha/beta hydrolase n=1 Tax=Hyalangium sp. TaxID=2028555 RepID=UPI002D512BC4|nr:lysophospholipase [Hyalangium sp.]HYH96499.1 alpha/beta hydrolase [Hyalangium sp.]
MRPPGTGKTAFSAAAGRDVSHEESTFEGTGGLQLFSQSWRPVSEEPRAVLIVVHGLRDHSTRYGELAEHLVGQGFAVHAFDLRGHGHSEGVRVHIDSFEEYLTDLGLFLERVRQREPGRPVFLLGHSMGGAIVTLFTVEKKPDIQGMVLSAPALKPGADVSKALIATTKVIGGVLPNLKVLELDPKQFSRDPAVVKENETDPLIFQQGGPARTASRLLGALNTISERMEEVSTPVLVMHGTADTVTDPEGSKALVKSARSTDKTLKLYHGLYHDLLHEPEKAEVIGDVAQWLKERVATAP